MAAWYKKYHGFFLYKEIEGNFDITLKVKITGKKQEKPVPKWSLAGILIRKPFANERDKELLKENWIYLMKGTDDENNWTIDSKINVNGSNEYDISESFSGWEELRIIRLNNYFISMLKNNNNEWIIRHRHRADFPAKLQVGINATTGSNLSGTMSPYDYNSFNNTSDYSNEYFIKHPEKIPDSEVYIDYINFKRPLISGKLNKVINDNLILKIKSDELIKMMKIN